MMPLPFRRGPVTRVAAFLAWAAALTGGCRSTPVLTIPATHVRNASCCGARETEKLDPRRLAQARPERYRIGSGDVLGVYVEGLSRSEPPIARVSATEPQRTVLGDPVSVDGAGHIALHSGRPIPVAGLDLSEADRVIREALSDAGHRVSEASHGVIVTLVHPRRYRVTVIREDLAAEGSWASRGASASIELPAYQNDILHALSETGGFPGSAARGAVFVVRRAAAATFDPAALCSELDEYGAPSDPDLIEIPLVYDAARPPQFSPTEILLHEGDLLFVPARRQAYFYTGGLLPGGCHPLPADREIDVLEAMAIAGGCATNAAGAAGGCRVPGRNTTASQVTIVRRKHFKQHSIRVDLRRALLDLSERVIIQPGDLIVLEYRGGERWRETLARPWAWITPRKTADGGREPLAALAAAEGQSQPEASGDNIRFR